MGGVVNVISDGKSEKALRKPSQIAASGRSFLEQLALQHRVKETKPPRALCQGVGAGPHEGVQGAAHVDGLSSLFVRQACLCNVALYSSS